MAIDADDVTLSEIALYTPHKDGGALERQRKLFERLSARGFPHVRITRVPGGIWAEGWAKQPRNAGEFNLNHARKVLPK